MSIQVALHHRTVYRYDRPVTLSPQVVRLRPAPHCRTPILSYSLKVTPKTHFINWQQDPQGNYLARLVFPELTTEFTVDVDLIADMAVINPFDFFLEPDAEHYPFAYPKSLEKELAPFRECEAAGPKLRGWLDRVTVPNAVRSVDFLVQLNLRLQQEIKYLIRLEPGVQSCEETLTKLSGSCRDSAWLLVQILRHLGFAARFASGYLIQLTADQKSLDGPSGPEADFTDLHAWTEVYLPGAGWIGLDPTSGLLAGEGHIPLACTPDPRSAAPIEGAVSKCEVSFDHHMQVRRVREAPRTTKPYTPEQWAEIDRLGREIDLRLKQGDVRLSMGGEPTFVSIDDMDGAEWTTAALGPTKRLLAGRLMRRLAGKFAGDHPLLHYGQGKWYPGEQLPRWALSAYWRRDGEPIWLNQALLAHDEKPTGARFDLAETFSKELAERLGVQADWAQPAFEDVAYYLWREQRLPVNVDPTDPRLKDPLERARIARVFEAGLDQPTGMVLPLGRQAGEWMSGPWFMRNGRIYLVPGDSAMGFRLPLDSLPWVNDLDMPWHHQQDPFDRRPPLPARQMLQRQGQGQAAAFQQEPRLPGTGESAGWLLRTALCVEARDGFLHVFMPPTQTAEDYLDLVTKVEETASALQTPVLVEGYRPPQDPRLAGFSVTPDPGVIEVNIHPSTSWDELRDRTTILYEEARQSRLGTEKFMIDGRHVGTGGGNHITLGGPTPADSPLLRRPDLLKSLVSYWHNHPSLSYLFSGLFIGPTSQAPRVDEAREDAVHELEIALAQIQPGQETPPWLVDRVMRHVLTDVTGNTHRSEFCIDKLYDPSSATGRLGILELRAFEMPPHAEMSLAQQLLVRGLVAEFWDKPYEQPLVRWGNRLHDQFLLPHFVSQDFADVIGDLNRAGLPFDADWFRAHLEFRFPLVGEAGWRGVGLELRNALEPWHVLGEEPGAGGTVRFVDSSVERVQVKLSNMVAERYRLSCNGRVVPLTSTGTEGEYVAGVRFRAWQPPNCLHPTIGVHSPLVFDLVDSWSGRSVGGCTYYVAHPGGRNYDSFPVNANEAESRRLARFEAFGHTPGPLAVGVEGRNPDMPLTLDLRRPLGR